MKKFLRDCLSNNARYLALMAIVFGIGLIFTITNTKFIGFSNIMNIVRQTCVLAIISIGMTGIILTGGIDLSVGANVALSGMAAIKMLGITGNVLVAILTSVAVGLLIGLANGFLVGKMDITAFIATLAMMSVARGATMLISNAAAVTVDHAFIKFIGQGDVLGVPFVLLLVVGLFVLGIWSLNSLTFGQHLYAIGGNAMAARAMGIDVKKRLMQVYTLEGALVGVSAIITVGRLGSAQPYAGLNLEFDVITAVVLGGTSLVGGIGSLGGTVLGTLLVGEIANGLGLMSISPFINYIVKGCLILSAVGIDMIFVRLKERRLMPEIEMEEKEAFKEELNTAAYCKNETDLELKMEGITKAFPGMKALDSVDMVVRKGEIHALMGENGAGKSTLMKILAGEYKMDAGKITVNNRFLDISSTRKANEIGIGIIHQEFSLVRELSVYQNMFLGKELQSKIPFLLNKRNMRERSRAVLQSIGITDIDVRKLVKELTVSEQQMIEIAKVLLSDSWLIIMDEPTSALTEEEKNRLFAIMRTLKEKGVAIIYISHRMQEIFEIADRITVLRDGKFAGSKPTGEFTEAEIIKQMVGRELQNVFERAKLALGQAVIEVKNLTRHGKFRDVSFQVRAGEVLGLSGLMGAGRTEIAKCIFGLDRADSGEIVMLGKALRIRRPSDAIKEGIAYVPEDRLAEGFIPYMSIKKNIALPSYGRIGRGKYNKKKEQEISDRYIKALNIKTVSDKKNVLELSGGNQQKVILGKWMAMDPKVLILDEPTRGIDVGAKAEIHQLIHQIAKQGIAIILISSELPELLGCADNVVVLRQGEVSAYYSADEATQDGIMRKSVPNTSL